MECKECGKVNADGTSFCIACGSPLVAEEKSESTARGTASLFGESTQKGFVSTDDTSGDMDSYSSDEIGLEVKQVGDFFVIILMSAGI